MFIRFAQFGDLDAIIGESAQAVLDGAWAPITSFDIETSRRNVARAIEDRLAFVAEHEGRIVGFMVHRLLSWIFSDHEKYLEAAHFYVTKEGRGLRAAQNGLRTAEALLQASKDLSNATGLQIYACPMWGPRIEARDRFMRKAGFTHVGGTFVFAPARKEALQAAE